MILCTVLYIVNWIQINIQVLPTHPETTWGLNGVSECVGEGFEGAVFHYLESTI